MKKKLLNSMRVLLVAAGLCVGASASWAAPTGSNILSTMTGIVGPTDNSSASFTYGSKVITIAAGETYTMTFVNYNAGSGNKWNNWILEGNNGSLYFDFRADGGYWGGLLEGGSPAATASYTGSTHTSVSGATTDVDDVWMAAYNGVTVTLTATRSNDGATLTFTHSATTNTSVKYSGTFTVTLADASSTINFYITNEASHQLITNVTYTNGTEGAIYTRSVHTAGAKWGSGYDGTYESTVDAAAEFYNTTTSNWKGAAYAKFAYSLPASATVLSATLTYNTNQGGSKSRDEKIFYMSKDFDIDWANFSGQKNVDLSYSTYRNDVVTVATGGSGVRKNLTGDVTAAVRAIYAENQDFILFQWSENAGAANLYGNGATDYNAPQLEINYTTATPYDYAVKAKDGSGNLLKVLASGTYFEGSDAITVAYPQYILSSTTLYEIANNGSGDWYRKSFTPDADDYELTLTYNKATVENVVFYTEAEDVTGATVGNYTNRASNGQVGYTGDTGTYKEAATIAPGKYIIYVKGLNGNSTAKASKFKLGDQVFDFSITNGTNQTGNSEELTIYETSTLSFASYGNASSGGVDWFYVKRTGDATVSGTITDCGWSTFASNYNLDLSGVTNGTAYYASAATDNTVTLTPCDDKIIEAGTGIMVKGTPGATFTIPVTASDATFSATNYLKGQTSTGNVAASTLGTYHYVFGYESPSKYGFYNLTEDTEVPAGKAYLETTTALSAATARLSIVFEDETTGINTIQGEAPTANGYYNLSGQRVSQPTKGLYIVNGKKVIIK